MERIYDFLNEKETKTIEKEPLQLSSHVTYFKDNAEKQQKQLYITNSWMTVEEYEVISEKINLKEIIAVTISSTSSEFILHINNNSDIRLANYLHRKNILEKVIELKTADQASMIPFYFVDTLNLDVFTRCQKDAAHGLSRLPDDKFKVMVDLELFFEQEKNLQKRRINNRKSTKTLYGVKTMSLSIENFELLHVLGRGAAGKVLLVEAKFGDHKQYAMKIIKKSKIIKADRIVHTKAEKAILSHVNHPFLVALKYAFQNETKLYFVMEFMKGGELFQHLRIKKRFSEAQTKFIAGCIVLALGHLHNKGYIYRDLKPENVLFDSTGYCKLTDFGLAKICTIEESARTFCGTPEYMAPEVILNKGCNRPADWWSLGILVYELIFGVPPFYDNNVQQMYKNTILNKLKFPRSIQCSPEAIDFMIRMLEKKPAKRLGSIADSLEIINHPWFSDIDWIMLMDKKIVPPYKPKTDVVNWADNFGDEFQSLPARDSSDMVDLQALKDFQKEFEDFDFTNDNFSGLDKQSNQKSNNSDINSTSIKLNKSNPDIMAHDKEYSPIVLKEKQVNSDKAIKLGSFGHYRLKKRSHFSDNVQPVKNSFLKNYKDEESSDDSIY